MEGLGCLIASVAFVCFICGEKSGVEGDNLWIVN